MGSRSETWYRANILENQKHKMFQVILVHFPLLLLTAISTAPTKKRFWGSDYSEDVKDLRLYMNSNMRQYAIDGILPIHESEAAPKKKRKGNYEAEKDEEKSPESDDGHAIAKEVKTGGRIGRKFGIKATAPSDLIILPSLGRGYGLPLREVWGIWNTTLRDLDPWHMGLIADRKDKSYGTNCKTWAGRWYMKYQYYKEIGKEIDRRIVKGKGKSVDEIIDRLEFIRLSIPQLLIQGLADGIRHARGAPPFFKSKKKIIYNIRQLLEAEY
jgi:hypothetical protein